MIMFHHKNKQNTVQLKICEVCAIYKVIWSLDACVHILKCQGENNGLKRDLISTAKFIVHID